MPREIEIKLAVDSVPRTRALLRRHGFTVTTPRVFEANTLYDTAALALRAQRQLLRIRTVGRKYLVTYKGSPLEGPYKSREEIEFNIGDANSAALMLLRLGYHPVFRYEKYRTVFGRPREAGHVTLDETPIGIFLELEGPPAWIDRTARLLGFPRESYITLSYGSLYLADCQARGVAPANMVFTSMP